MIEGIIIKGIGGLYYVDTDKGVFECKARGLFRKEKIKPLVGDNVLIDLNDIDNTGYIMEIKSRNTELIRPPVANVNQSIIVFSLKNPKPNLWLLDRFLILSEKEKLNAIIVFNKVDLVSDDLVKSISKIYENTGYKIIKTSTKSKEGINDLKEILKDSISVFAGPSGVGKSSLLNEIEPDLKLQTGDISTKTKRGKHTTRSSSLLELSFGGFVVDTPGFSSLDLSFIKEENLEIFFPEMNEESLYCKFNDCKHNKEPGCSVKKSVKEGKISEERYENYLSFLSEIKKSRRY